MSMANILNEKEDNRPPATKQYWKNLDNGKKRINLDIPEDVWDRVTEHAESWKYKKRDVVIKALKYYLNL